LFSVSPNPFNNAILIGGYSYSGDIEYKIYDLNSKLVKEGKTLIDEPIIIDGIMNGIYLITLKYDNRVESHRIIKS